MAKVFNVTGPCDYQYHYMVDITKRIIQIKALVDRGAYFTINRARQYGKTTTLDALSKYLEQEYEVIYLDFQVLSYMVFENEINFVKILAEELREEAVLPLTIDEKLYTLTEHRDETVNLYTLFKILSEWCLVSEKPIVLIIDEVDSATNNQVFIDFLAQLRSYYIRRTKKATFKSVILAGVYDVKNIKHKISPDVDNKRNSPWNIAADFDVDMSLSCDGIKGMLAEYEEDYHTGMDLETMSQLIYSYTSGYPFLVSRICQLIDEKIIQSPDYSTRSLAWTKAGFLESVKYLLSEKNPLFESLVNKLQDYSELRKMLYAILIKGDKITFNSDNDVVNLASMFGFVKNDNGTLAIANRIFETRLYNLFLSEEEMNNRLYTAGRALLTNDGEIAFKSGASATITGNMLTTAACATIRSDKEMLKNLGRDAVPDYQKSFK